MKNLVIISLVLGAVAQGCSSTKNFVIDKEQVYPVRVGAAYGFINGSGDIVVEPQYDSIGWQRLYPISVMKGSNWGYVGRHGEVIFEPQFQKVYPFVGNVAWYQHNVAHGLLSIDGRKLTDAFFAYTAEFDQGISTNIQGSAGTCVLMDTLGQVTNVPFCFHEQHDGIGLYQVNARFGYATLKGRQFIKPQFAKAEIFAEGVAAAAHDSSLYGYIDTCAEWVIPPRFKVATTFEGGVARVNALNSMWGVIDHAGKFIIPPRFRSINEFRNGLAKVALVVNGLEVWGLIDTAGNVLLEPTYTFIGRFTEGLAPVSINGKYGYINTLGEVVIEPQFLTAYNFSEGLAPIRAGRKKAFIDTKGKMALAEYDDVAPFDNGLAMVTTGGSIADFFAGKPGVKFMYINHKGEAVWSSSER